MGALNSLRPAVSSLVRNPVLLVVTGLFALIQLPQLVLQSVHPLLSAVVSMLMSGVLLLLVPFYQGGVLGMARDALAGTTDLDTCIHEGKSNYLQLLLGYGGLVLVNSVIMGFALVTGLVAAVVMADGNPGTLFFVVLGTVGLVLLLAYLLVLFFLQFYGHAIVLNDTDVVDGFQRSVALVRANLVSALGYTVITVVGGGGIGLLAALASLAFSPQPPEQLAVIDLSVPVLAGAALVYVVAIAVAGAFWATYSVAFYQSLDSAGTGTGPTVRDAPTPEVAEV